MSRSRRRRALPRRMPLTAVLAVAAMTAAVAAAIAVSFCGGGVPLTMRNAADAVGAQSFASPACSGIVQAPDAFMDTLGAH